jgi:protoporphyrinogen oxidase
LSGPRVAVIGAGPAGLAAGLWSARHGAHVDIYERSSAVGGLARSFELWGQWVEFGAHLLLREDMRIDQIWRELIGDAFARVPRETWIVTQGHWLRYPYEPLQVVRALGPRSSASVVGGLLRRPKTPDDSLENWIVSRFGRPAFELLVADYLRKQFGRQASDLDADMAGSLLGFRRHPSIAHLIQGALRSTPEVPVVRPLGGVGRLCEAIADEIRRLGGRVHNGAAVSAVGVSNDRVTTIAVDGDRHQVDHVISTAPLPALLGSLSAPPPLTRLLPRLSTRSVVIVYLLFPGRPPFTGQWVYIADADWPVSRITNFAAWSPADSTHETILAFEIWCDPSDQIWSAEPSELSVLALGSLARIGLASPAPAQVAVRRLPHVFPVIARGYRDALHPIQAWLDGIGGLHSTGRFGSFANAGVHESMMLGIECADAALAAAA